MRQKAQPSEINTHEAPLHYPEAWVEKPDVRSWAKKLWKAHSWLHRILHTSKERDIARRRFYDGMVAREREIRSRKLKVHPLEWLIIRDASRVMRNILSKRCERMAGFSTLDCLWKMARERWDELPQDLSPGFFEELHRLLLAVRGKSGVYERSTPDFTQFSGRKAAIARSLELDALAGGAEAFIDSYTTGFDRDIIKRHEKNRKRILKALQASSAAWEDWQWQLKHVIRDETMLGRLIRLTEEEREAIHLAKEHRIPFGITPYYCSLMDEDPSREHDHAIRTQVIPSRYYVESMIEHREKGTHSADFMMEHDTSPIDLITRRYPRVAIFKPYNTCAQICVYCQRNWEIQDVLCPQAMASKESLEAALRWFEEHPAIREVLITGGDAFIMKDQMIEMLLKRFSAMKHVERIRFGTRTPVVLPQRISEKLIDILQRYHRPPHLDICVVTHYEHVAEISPRSAEAVQRLRNLGISVYNQMVLTIENSRRFEAVATRLALKRIGVDPYYTFMMKGKRESDEMRVPIARALQEQKEESRLMPGTARTDETVYNVPRLGKNYIKAWQHHDVIMIMPDGARVFEFHPWEKNIALADVYVDKDVPIYDYLLELARRGEDIKEYESIWYYY